MTDALTDLYTRRVFAHAHTHTPGRMYIAYIRASGLFSSSAMGSRGGLRVMAVRQFVACRILAVYTFFFC